ncbi:MAG: hypothetical protein D9V47_09520 [Clostridia bacterium]|nr:MAG: hypothetical protein D9V47_09520 [Clostridia bacterium]
MGNLSERDKTLLVIVAAVAMVFLFYRFVWAARWPAYQEARQELAELENQLEQARGKVSRLPAVEKRWEAAKRELAQTRQQFRLNLLAGDPYLELAREAEARAEITSLQPGEVKDNGSYLELPLVLKARGPYLSLVNFIERVEKLPNLPRISVLHLVAKPDIASPGQVKVDAELDMSLYGSKTPLGGGAAWAVLLPGRLDAFEPAIGALAAGGENRGATGAPAGGPGAASPGPEGTGQETAATGAGGAGPGTGSGSPGDAGPPEGAPGSGTGRESEPGALAGAGGGAKVSPKDIAGWYRFPAGR